MLSFRTDLLYRYAGKKLKVGDKRMLKYCDILKINRAALEIATKEGTALLCSPQTILISGKLQ